MVNFNGTLKEGNSANHAGEPAFLFFHTPIILYNTHMFTSSLPTHLQGLFWTKKLEHIDLHKDEVMIIHHVLRYGKIEDIAWLLKTYPQEKIRQVFLTQPMTIYSRSSFHFAKNAILHISKDVPHEQQYLQSFS